MPQIRGPLAMSGLIVVAALSLAACASTPSLADEIKNCEHTKSTEENAVPKCVASAVVLAGYGSSVPDVARQWALANQSKWPTYPWTSAFGVGSVQPRTTPEIPSCPET